MSNLDFTYLVIHGLSTLGLVFLFFLRIEHRLTRVETKVENIENKVKG